MSDGIIPGFERRRVIGAGVEIDLLIGGSGPPLLLLHGYPQTRMMWKAMAPRLAERFTVVAPDLRGYGRSAKPAGDPKHETYSKRAMANDQIATMHALGFSRFSVAGHDRGARVAYRLALDHPQAVERLAVMDIVPTADVWANANAESAMKVYHWYFLAQPFPFPERLIERDAEFFIKYKLKHWAGNGFEFDPECLEDYVRCFCDPACIHATCEDYRAGYTIDRDLDEADRGKKKIEAPLLVLWGNEGIVAKAQPLDLWRQWASDVHGQDVPGGHFVCEEAADDTGGLLTTFLG